MHLTSFFSHEKNIWSSQEKLEISVAQTTLCIDLNIYRHTQKFRLRLVDDIKPNYNKSKSYVYELQKNCKNTMLMITTCFL